MASAVEKILAFCSPHFKTAGRALQGAGAGLMAYDPPAAAPVGGAVALNGASPSVAEGAFVAPTATLVGPVTVEPTASVLYGATVEASGSPLVVAGCVGANAVVRGGVGAGAVVGANAVVLGSLGERAVVEAAAVVGPGATVAADGRVAAGSVLGGAVGEAELWAGSPAEKVRALSPAELAAAAEDAALAAASAEEHAAECAKDWATVRADLAAREDALLRHPRYFQPKPEGADEMRSVGGQDTGIAPGRILNSPIKHADGESPHGDATRN